jgi:hypothetical protein
MDLGDFGNTLLKPPREFLKQPVGRVASSNPSGAEFTPLAGEG